MESVLSYFRSYFNPDGCAPYINHSTGQIASHLHEVLQEYGPVQYYGSKERPRGLEVDLFIGHFWAFEELCRQNRFQKRIAFYSVSDPGETRTLMRRLARDYDVPEPLFDLPPDTFDHEATMALADRVLVVGNRYTRDTFPPRWHHKIRMINYSVDASLYDRDIDGPRRNEFCYVATYCGLRKGFMDVLRTWSGVDPSLSRLHAVGRLNPPWDDLLEEHNNGSIVAHGWVESHTLDYLRIIKSCRYAYIPTLSEGQMGSLLEVIHAGCIPITTQASGIDEEVLAHCIIVEPFDYDQHRHAIKDVLSWTTEKYENRRGRLNAAVRARQNWDVFRTGIKSTIDRLITPYSSDPSCQTHSASKDRNRGRSRPGRLARVDQRP